MNENNQWNQGNGQQSNGQWTGPSPEQQGYSRQDGYQQSGGAPYGQDWAYNSNTLEGYYARNNAFDSCPEGKSRGIAGLLAIFLGGFGVQYFYLGKITGGFLCILLSIVTCGLWEIVTLIQGILMLCMSNYDFRRKYVLNESTMPMF